MPSPTRRPCSRAGLAIGAVALALLGAACSSPALPPPAAPVPSAPAPAPLPQSYQLTGDEGGSKFEGIGYDDASGTFYVSEITGGEVHRGRVDAPATAEWLAGAGTDGRFTARGITVDDAGRVYIAGGPNGIEHPDAPDLWVYDRDGVLLAALDTGVDRAFLNDVAIGPDGAAYFTNSNAPQVFRVVAEQRPLGGHHLGRRHRHDRHPGRVQPRRHRRQPGRRRVAGGAGQRRQAVAVRPGFAGGQRGRDERREPARRRRARAAG